METDGDKGDVCWRGVHSETGEDGEVCKTDGTAVQKGECHASYVLFLSVVDDL